LPRRKGRSTGDLRYKGGLVTYLEVVSSENAALAARLTAVDISIRRQRHVLLVRALAGLAAALSARAPTPSASTMPVRQVMEWQ